MTRSATVLTAERRVLCVDDEPMIRELFARLLESEFDVETAADGAQALEVFHHSGPFGVVLADLHMPRMGGAALLQEVHRRWPCSARVLLTGDGDVSVAAAAINAGHVFQFITKPVDPAALLQAVRRASSECCRLQAERDLLEGTLQSCIRVLTQVLSLVNPAAFGRSARMAEITRHLSGAVGVADAWQYETAALLSQIGWITIPRDTLQKAHSQIPLSEREQALLTSQFRIAHDLLADVPRLRPVARMILSQAKTAEAPGRPAPASSDGGLSDVEALGSQMLHLAALVARFEQDGRTLGESVARARSTASGFDPRLLAALGTIPEASEGAQRAVSAAELLPTMMLDEDVVTRDGTLMLARGQDLTPAAIRLLRNAFQAGLLREPFHVIGG